MEQYQQQFTDFVYNELILIFCGLTMDWKILFKTLILQPVRFDKGGG